MISFECLFRTIYLYDNNYSISTTCKYGVSSSYMLRHIRSEHLLWINIMLETSLLNNSLLAGLNGNIRGKENKTLFISLGFQYT